MVRGTRHDREDEHNAQREQVDPMLWVLGMVLTKQVRQCSVLVLISTDHGH